MVPHCRTYEVGLYLFIKIRLDPNIPVEVWSSINEVQSIPMHALSSVPTCSCWGRYFPLTLFSFYVCKETDYMLGLINANDILGSKLVSQLGVSGPAWLIIWCSKTWMDHPKYCFHKFTSLLPGHKLQPAAHFCSVTTVRSWAFWHDQRKLWSVPPPTVVPISLQLRRSRYGNQKCARMSTKPFAPSIESRVQIRTMPSFLGTQSILWIDCIVIWSPPSQSK